ncbi:hypothetical protein UVI_02004620 [Ustilaginoidea virens]|nr:hypothetical protein UVI_02004620 [Ustilaginoidea virens]
MPSIVLHHGQGTESTALRDGPAIQGGSIPTHPLGVKPLGNRYLSKGPNAKTNSGIWGLLPDEMLMLVLEQLDAGSLLSLGSTCKFLFAFCHSDELWKALFLL